MATDSPDSVGHVQDREAPRGIRLFLSGDVMTGRGVDQILPHPGKPQIHESYLRSALDYVRLAEAASGRIRRPVAFDYVWGDALAVLAARKPRVRIINLETAVTTADDPWAGKGIHYRMHPGNAPFLTAAHIDCCVLANNHVLDWGRRGLIETLDTLHGTGTATAGAGRDASEARAPAIVSLPDGGRVLIFAIALSSSGVPDDWAAGSGRPGVNLIHDLAPRAIGSIVRDIQAVRQAGDIVVASIHWGENWGYDIPAGHRRLAHALIDDAAVNVVHGHSSHHALGIEVYRQRLILYGCGDLLNDYEGIRGHEDFRPDLALMYLPVLDRPTGRLARLDLVPMQIRHLRLNRPSLADAAWLARRLSDNTQTAGATVRLAPDGSLRLVWKQT